MDGTNNDKASGKEGETYLSLRSFSPVSSFAQTAAVVRG